jgi:GT2 family glycosyltransferase
MTATDDRTGIVIIHYANLKNVMECLDSILAGKNAKEFCPIIVSNNAVEPVEPLREKYGKWIHVIELIQNTGFTGANNAGITWAQENLGSPVVMMLNDDTTVEKTALVTLRDILISRPKVAALCPVIYFTPKREFHPGYQTDELGKVIWYGGGIIDWKEVIGFHQYVDEVDRGQVTTHDTFFATGCCVALRQSALKKIGLLDEKAFLYWEDTELSQRLLNAGWRIQVTPDAHIWHKNAGSSNGSGSKLQVYYQTRNRFWFGWKYAPGRTKVFLARHAWRLLRQGTREEKRAILDWLQGKYGQNPSLHS